MRDRETFDDFVDTNTRRSHASPNAIAARTYGPRFRSLLLHPDNDGYPVSDPERPYALGLVGLSPQWADITGKLHRLGISIETNTAGVVSGITFADDQSKRAWDNWWAVAVLDLATLMSNWVGYLPSDAASAQGLYV